MKIRQYAAKNMYRIIDLGEVSTNTMLLAAKAVNNAYSYRAVAHGIQEMAQDDFKALCEALENNEHARLDTAPDWIMDGIPWVLPPR